MSTRKTGLTPGRHGEIGLELARMRDRLSEISVEIMNAYPKRSRAHDLAFDAGDGLDALRCELDARFSAECPDATADAYYPPRELRDAR